MASIVKHGTKYRVFWRNPDGTAPARGSQLVDTKKEAEALREEKRREEDAWRRGRNRRPAAFTLVETLGLYLNHLVDEKRAPTTIQTYEAILGRFIMDIGDMMIAEVQNAHVNEWRLGRLRQGIDANTVANNLKVLRAFFNWCVK